MGCCGQKKSSNSKDKDYQTYMNKVLADYKDKKKNAKKKD